MDPPADTDPSRDPPWWHWQTAVNQRWPSDPTAFAARVPIEVQVRIVWSRDGEDLVDGVASRWDRRHVYVAVRDRRLATLGVWVAPADVHRR